MSWKGIQALNQADSPQRKPELRLLGSRTPMSMTETLSQRLEAIELDRPRHPAPASDHYIPARERTTSGGEESGSMGDDGRSESYT